MPAATSNAPSPFIKTINELLKLFDRGPTWWWEHREELEKAGFPQRDPVVGGWPRAAAENWIAERARVAE